MPRIQIVPAPEATRAWVAEPGRVRVVQPRGPKVSTMIGPAVPGWALTPTTTAVPVAGEVTDWAVKLVVRTVRKPVVVAALPTGTVAPGTGRGAGAAAAVAVPAVRAASRVAASVRVMVIWGSPRDEQVGRVGHPQLISPESD